MHAQRLFNVQEGVLKPGDIDEKEMNYLSAMPASLGIEALNKLYTSNLSHSRNVPAYLQGNTRHASSRPRIATAFANQPSTPLPSDRKITSFPWTSVGRRLPVCHVE